MRLNKPTRYLLRTLAVLLALLIVSYLALAIYVRVKKKDLILTATTQIGHMIGGTVSLEDISVAPFKNFPFISIVLKKVTVTDSLYTQHRHPFFYAEKIYVRVNPFPLITGRIALNKVQLDNGALYMYTDAAGYSNTYLLKPKKKNTKPPAEKSTANILDRIELNHFTATIEDLSKDKLFDFDISHLEAKTSSTDSSTFFDIKESILVKSLAFKRSKGTFLSYRLLEGKYRLELVKTKKALLFKDMELQIAKQPFLLNGFINFGEKTFSINAGAKNLLVDEAKKILTAHIARSVGLVAVRGPLDVQASLSGSLAGGEPLVNVHWVTTNNIISTPLMDFTNCAFKGSYTNEVDPQKARHDTNSKVELQEFSGNWHGLNMKAKKLVVHNLKYPTVHAELSSAVSLPDLNSILRTDAMALTSGKGLLQFSYTGPIMRISPANATFSGSLFIDSGTIHTAAGDANLTRCRGNIRFANQDIIVDSLYGRLGDNPFRMWGSAKNVLALIGDSKEAVSLSWNVYAPVLNIDHISSIFLRKIPNKPKAEKKTNLSKTAGRIDDLLSSGHVAVSIRADKLQYKKFEGSKLEADILIDANTWALQKAALNSGIGSFVLSARVNEQSGGRFTMQSAIQLKKVDAQKTFRDFDGFGIKAINDKNIQGVLSANANVSLGLDNKGGFDMNTLSGNADFSIVNGALINFKPVMKIQETAFKDRDFSNIRFTEIKDKIEFSRGQVKFDRMVINSTVLTLFAEGLYDLNGKNTDISIQVPLKNLKKRDKDFTPEQLTADSKGGTSVYLRARSTEDGGISIKYDPFKKLRKKS